MLNWRSRREPRDEVPEALTRLQELLRAGKQKDVLTEYFLSNTQRRTSSHTKNELQRKTVASRGTGSIIGILGGSFSDTAAQLQRAKVSEKQAEVTLYKLLQSDLALRLFYIFCKSRYAAENLLFWVDVECFQNLDWKPVTLLGIRGHDESTRSRSPEYMEAEAFRIFKTYLSDLAKNQVCLTSAMASEIQAKFQNRELDFGMFREAQRMIFRDIEKNSYIDFLSHLNEEGVNVIALAMREQFDEDCSASESKEETTAL